MALFLGILVLQRPLAFWTVKSLEVTNVFTYGGVETEQNPMVDYVRWFRRLLTFVIRNCGRPTISWRRGVKRYALAGSLAIRPNAAASSCRWGRFWSLSTVRY
ncbi:MAG: ABC-2 family transporter protein [Rhodoferax sp.]